MNEKLNAAAAEATSQAAPAKPEAVVEAPKAEAVAPVAAEPAQAPEAQAPVVDEKTEEVKAPEAGAEAVEYALTLPEGSQLDPVAVEQVASFAKEHGLSNDKAQAILERESQAIATFAQKQEAELKHKVDVLWPEAVHSDKEIGGPFYKENVELAHRALKSFSSEQFNKMLESSGLGNHPEVVRVFSRIGKAMAPDKLVTGGTQGSGEVRIEDLFYPELKSKE